jgi:hypothetical protein
MGRWEETMVGAVDGRVSDHASSRYASYVWVPR